MMENMNTQSNKKNIILVIILFITLISIILFFVLRNDKSKKADILIDIKDSIKQDDIYYISKKIDSINFEIVNDESVKEIKVSIKSGKLDLYEKMFNISKFSLDDVTLPLGTSNLCLTINFVNNSSLDKCFSLYNTSEENLGDLDTKDSDYDGLVNYYEDMLGTNKNVADEDNDNLNDYQEIFITFTNPSIDDTDNDGILDGEEDFDNDFLSNIKEVDKGSNPFKSDTDGDGLSDKDEIEKYQSLPSSIDSDEDGIPDYDEAIILNSSLRYKNYTIDVTKTYDNNLVSVSIDGLKSKYYNSLSITENKSLDVRGALSSAYNFEIDIDKVKATIEFDLSNIDLNENVNPKIYYYNEENGTLDELNTIIENNKAKAKVEHFSTYILVNKNEMETIFNNVTSELQENSKNLDVVFVMDISQSMDENDPNDYRKQLMSNFVSSLSESDRVGVVIFRRNAVVLNNGLSSSISDKMKLITHIFNIENDSGYTHNSGTNGPKGLYEGINLFDEDSNNKKYIIFLTDGDDTVKSYTYDEIYDMANAKGVKIITIGLGENANVDLLNTISNSTNGKSYGKINSDDLYNTYKDIVAITMDYKKDTNKDGISDYVTMEIVKGNITDLSGKNPFEGLSYEDIQKDNDIDKDGLINGKEILVSNTPGKVYLIYRSNPLVKDSDGDTLLDSKDNNPLIPFDSSFTIGGTLKDKPDISSLEKSVEEFNSLFNTGEKVTIDGKKYIKYKRNGNDIYSPDGFINWSGELINVAVTTAAAIGDNIGAADANNAWKKYYKADGTPYTEKDLATYTVVLGLKEPGSIYASEDVQYHFKNNYERVMKVAEDTLKNGDTLVIKSNDYLVGAGTNVDFDLDQNTNVFGFLHNSSAHIISQVSRDGNTYKMKVRYFILDIYDWKSVEECNIESAACVSEVHYFNDMLLGKAKGFLVNIEYDHDILWTKGEEPVITYLHDTPYK